MKFYYAVRGSYDYGHVEISIDRDTLAAHGLDNPERPTLNVGATIEVLQRAIVDLEGGDALGAVKSSGEAFVRLAYYVRG